MEFRPGWTYIYSELLKQHIALHNKTGWLYCEDGVKYSPRELAILHKTYGGNPMPIEVHTLKKIFGGEIQDNIVAAAQTKAQEKANLQTFAPATNKTEKPSAKTDAPEFDIF